MLGRAVVVLGALLAIVACSSDEEPPRDPVELFCMGYCRLRVRCGASRERSTCEASCQSQGSNLSDLSAEGAERLGICIGELDCLAALDETAWNASFEACWKEARVRVTPTGELRAFCRSFAAASFECGYWFSTSDCEDAFGIWSSDVLAEVSRCNDAPSCEEFDGCVNATLGTE
jgi:hypothetical protein